MKKILFISLFVCLIAKLNAQSISADVIGFAGDNYANGSAMLTGTGGEPVSGTVTAGGNSIMQGFQQSYYSYWTGAVSTDWNMLTNWRGGPVPDANTDAVISAPSPFYPVINTNVFCRSLNVNTGASITVTAPWKMTVSH